MSDGNGANRESKTGDLARRTKQYALRIIRLFRALPTKVEAQVLGRQFLRSGTSVGANYREACRARTRVEFVSKLAIALQELEETAYWLELLVEAEIVPKAKLQDLQSETRQIGTMIGASIKTAKKKNK